jgi:hypothetical protein
MSLKVLTSRVEANPGLGWAGTLIAESLAWLGWLASHASQIGAIFGCVAAIFGVCAGWYTLRIQRRAWHQGEALSRSEPTKRGGWFRRRG